MRRTHGLPVVALVLLALVGASCGSDASESSPSGGVTVFAAASLTAAFTEIGEAFMVENPEVAVTFNFAASSELAAQIGQGAPADVFASADLSNMAKLIEADNNATEPVVFATNLAEIIVGSGNPKGISGVADLADENLIVVLCAPEVPCGKYASAVFENADVTVSAKSFEENVNAVVTKVTLGEADAGIVYKTDVTAAGPDAEGVEIPADLNVVAEYPIAVTTEARNTEGAQAFIDFVNGRAGPDDPRLVRLPRSMSRRRRSGRRLSLPIPVLALAMIAVLFFALPLIGLLWRAPWTSAWQYLTEDDALTALRLSMVCSLWATGLSVLFGVPLAWLLARVEFPGRGAVRALCTLSMVLPPVVGGVALFFALGRRGIVGQYLDRWFDITLPFTTAGVVVAQTFVAMPFLVITVEASLRQLDHRFEDAARTLGASRWYTFRRVTMPAIRPALVAGAVLAWARALGEFGATITFAGNFPGTTQTMPLAVYLSLETNPEEAIILALLLIAISFAVLVGMRDRWLGHSDRSMSTVAT